MTGERKRVAQRLRRGRGGDRGTPLRERGGLVVGAVLVLTVVVGVVAFVIGRGVSTPAEQAARAKPPAASLLTAPVVLTHARTTVVLRGTLTDGGAISVGVPGDLSGDLAVVTAVATAPGAHVGDGSLIAGVAGRPVFVLKGQIPAYSTMSYGSTGVEVTELQAGLEAAGFSVGFRHGRHLRGRDGGGRRLHVSAGRLRAGDRAGSGRRLGRLGRLGAARAASTGPRPSSMRQSRWGRSCSRRRCR